MASSTSSSSSPPSPLKMTLTISTVANVLTKLSRARHRHDTQSLHLASGVVPITHPSLSASDGSTNTKTCAKRVPLGQADRYVCKDAVDVCRLLRGSRASLLDKAAFLGGNVLIEESWVCQIRIPKNKQDGKFRVLIRYYASASRSSVPDPQKPVALDKVVNVPGLMTIVGREEIPP